MTGSTWRCRCTGPHYVHIENHGDRVVVVEALAVVSTWRYRFRLAWRALVYGKHSYVEVMLDDEAAAQIAEALVTPRKTT